MRLACSDLGQHLFPWGLSDDPSCHCGAAHETPSHYLLECPVFEDDRDNMFMELEHIYVIPIDMLLYGDLKLEKKENLKRFDAVQRYIIVTKRFSI